MKSAPPGKPKLERGERLVACVSQAVHGVDANRGLRSGHEFHGDFLLLDGVAGAESDGTAGRPDEGHEQQREKESAAADHDFQNVKIVTVEWVLAKEPIAGHAKQIGRVSYSLMGSAAAHASEAGAGVVASGFSAGDFALGLGIGHTVVDARDDLKFREPGVFQMSDLG